MVWIVVTKIYLGLDDVWIAVDAFAIGKGNRAPVIWMYICKHWAPIPRGIGGNWAKEHRTRVLKIVDGALAEWFDLESKINKND